MKKKAAKSESSRGPALHVWCKETDLEQFRAAAESEGFNTVSAWVLYHLRRIAKEVQK